MPLYAYICEKCGVHFEQMAPMRVAGLPAPCPHCQKMARRLFLAPVCISDTTNYSGDRTDFEEQFKSEAMREFHVAQAKKHGVNIRGKRYDPQLARFPGDPKAWVGSDTDVRKVLEHRGWGGKGAVNVTATNEPEPGQGPGLSEKIVRQLVQERMTVDPGQKVGKVVEDVINDHAPRNGKRIIRKPKLKRRAHA